MTERVAAWFDGVYRNVAVAAEVASEVAEVVDKTACAVMDSIAHLQEVYPDVFGNDPEPEEEPVEDEDEDVDPSPSREEKVKAIQDSVAKSLGTNTVWHNPAVEIADETVDIAYEMVLASNERAERAKENLRRAVDGRRFGPID